VKNNLKIVLVVIATMLIAISCKKNDDEKISFSRTDNITDHLVPDSIKINQLQYLGSHNSYKIVVDQEVLDYLREFRAFIPYDVDELDYTHETLEDQFTYYGIRQIELDFYADTEGGRFYNRRVAMFAGLPLESGVPDLLLPGHKLLHIPDVDYKTHHYTLVDAFRAVKRWSDNYPFHLPIFILLETKSRALGDEIEGFGFATSEPWDAARIFAIEDEIRQVFTEDRILTPDFVRGNYATLNEAILNKGWPTVGESRGKVVFLFDQKNINSIYKAGSPSLEGRLIFTDSNPGDPDGAFVKRNNVNSSDIQSLVEQGYLVRTMIGGTNEARTGDYSKWNRGLAIGAHFLSTDYYRPDARHATSSEWTDFHVQFETGSFRFNPITHP
jgi:hypothetical protein